MMPNPLQKKNTQNITTKQKNNPSVSGFRESEFSENSGIVCPHIPELPRNKICSLTMNWPYHTLGKNTGIIHLLAVWFEDSHSLPNLSVKWT